MTKNYLKTTIKPMIAVRIIIIGSKNFSSFSLLNFAKRNGAKKAPTEVPNESIITSHQLTLPNPKCIKKPTVEIPIKTKTEVPTISKASQPNAINPATTGVVPLIPTNPDITPPSKP